MHKTHRLGQRSALYVSARVLKSPSLVKVRRGNKDQGSPERSRRRNATMCWRCAFCFASLKRRCPRPRGLFNLVITKACVLLLLFGAVWSVTGSECLPGGKVFGVVVVFIAAVLGGRLVAMVQFPGLPPLPPLLGMLLAGLVLRNVPYVTDAVYVQPAWSAALRSVALAVILARAGLGLDPSALRRLKAVCLRVAVGPCVLEACIVATAAHFLLSMPWAWAFLLGFVLGAVSPAVVVPSMLLLQKEGYGCDKGIPTLLMAAGSFDDILAITGFSTCLGVAFSTGSTWMSILKGLLEVAGGIVAGSLLGFFLCLFPGGDQEDVVVTRSFLLLGFSIFAIFSTQVLGASGAGGLCTLVLAFLAALGWGADKAGVANVLGRCWDIFQPLLFGLIGAEIILTTLSLNTVGLVLRLVATFVLVHGAGFGLKEKLFIAIAWLPKATVQAAIGSKALDMARDLGDDASVKLGLDVLTLAVLAILITAPVGALGIGLAGPRLLSRQVKATETVNGGPPLPGQRQDPVLFETRL
ncbi:sodium/hydrogen exchanger 9B2 isoform X2 [Stigmatopora argus]